MVVLANLTQFAIFFASTVIFSLTLLAYGIFAENIDFEKIVFNIQLGMDTVNGFDYRVLAGWANKWTIIFTIFAAATFFLLCWYVFNKHFKSARHRWLVAIAYLASSLAYTAFVLNVGAYIKQVVGDGEDYFSNFYKDPADYQYNNPHNKKSLIIIYVESLENDLRSMRFLGKNPIGPIDDLPGNRVDHFYQARGTNWSFAGTVASQCALPVKSFYGNNMDRFYSNHFLPSATCLGDILKRAGYRQTFLTGPALKFAGMDKFYRSHGYDEMIGRDELRSILQQEDLFTGWGGGPHDDTLLEFAYELAAQYARIGRPFNLTIMTTDNHAPQGTPSPRCRPDEINAGFVGAFQCTSETVAAFVRKIQSNPLLKEIEIVIMGDHLFMANVDQQRMFSKDRTVYFKLIGEKKRNFGRNIMTHFDVVPTILDALGFLIDSDRKFGLGLSLYSSSKDYERIYKEDISPEILNVSRKYASLWGSTR